MVKVLYQFDDESRAVYQEHARRATRLLQEVDDALFQGAQETAAHLQNKYLAGGNPAIKRDGTSPLAARSGALRRSIDARRAGQWAAVVGALRNVKSYAGVLLGAEEVTIRPKNSKYLWIPIGDNRAKQGGAKMSPREARSKKGPRGGSRLSIFKSKTGKMLAFLRDEAGGSYKRGKNKGRTRGKLMFVLLTEVKVKGTDALARAVEDKRERVTALIQEASDRALGGTP